MADTKYYVIDDRTYFRIVGAGYFSRWDATGRRWVAVSDKDGRDYLSRAIENGDAFPVKPAEMAQVAQA